MNKLTRKQAIIRTARMWRKLAKTGGNKNSYFEGYRNKGLANRPIHNCFLCEYALQQGGMGTRECPICPYYQKFGRCTSFKKKTHFMEWCSAADASNRRAYAGIIVRQLEELEETD